MNGIPELPVSLKSESPAEYARFQGFLETHRVQVLSWGGVEIPFCVCGRGDRTILSLAGGWGGIEILYETILGFEEHNRMVIVDISPFDDPAEMSRGIDSVLEEARIDRVVLMGQSLSGILAQLYFRQRVGRVEALVLTNTLAPNRERNRWWGRILFACLPFPLVRVLLRPKIRRLERFDRQLTPEVEERRRFARALLSATMERSFTRERIGRILKLCWCFNEQGEYAEHELRDWTGQALLVTSEDDPYHSDAKILESALPGARQYCLPSGFRHMAPQICRQEFESATQAFLDSLERRDPPRSSVKTSTAADDP
jgi:pimeloyl-ACP methyl ester carboxylesterase